MNTLRQEEPKEEKTILVFQKGETTPEEGQSERESPKDISPSFNKGEKPKSTANKVKDKTDKGAGMADLEKGGEEVAKKGVRQALLAAGRTIAAWASQALAAVAAWFGWPVLTGCLIIFLIILLIFGGLACSSMSGYFGRTPQVKLDPKKDQRLVLEFLAAGSDKAAQRELIALDTIDAKASLDKIQTSNPQAQQMLADAKQLLDDIINLSESEEAVLEKIKQLLLLLEQLKNTLGDQAALIEQVINQVNNIQKLIDFYQRGHLVVNPKDMDYVRNYDVDRRVVKMLVYLITPQDQGGAGYERIKAKRIKFSYDTERKSLSKETEYSDEEEPNVSAHYTGQAVDIVEIDNIKCTQIKRRRLLNDLRSAMDPIPIKVAWQSEEGYLKGGGIDAYGQNMHQVFNNLGSGIIDDVLIGQLADIIGVELDPEKIKGRSFQEIALYVGKAVIKESFDIPGNYEMGNSLESIAEATGRAYLAQALNVPFEGVQGNSPDELLENIGRAVTEERMSLPAGSLEGKNSGEIFASTGRRLMEESLNLSRNSLTNSFNSTSSLKKVIGQGRVESSLGIEARTFYGSSIEEIQKRIGKNNFQTTFADGQTIDNFLGLETGTTAGLTEGRISPDNYNEKVGDFVFNKQLYIYQEPEKRAEVFGISLDSLNLFLAGDQNAFVLIGKSKISQTLSPAFEEQELIKQWFNSGQLPAQLDEEYLAGQFALKDNDLKKIFIKDLAKDVFYRIGQVETINNLTANSKFSAYLKPVKEVQFYFDRLETIKSNLDYLEDKAANQEVRNKVSQTKNLVNGLLGSNSIKSIRNDIGQIQENIKFIEENTSSEDPKSAEKIKAIKKAVNEMIEGKEIANFNDIPPQEMEAKTEPQVELTKKDLYSLLTGSKNISDLVYSFGLRKWEIELDLPYQSLYNTYSEIKKNRTFENSEEILLINIGKSKLKEYAGASSKPAETVDKELFLVKGTTADYRSGKISKEAYNKAVGMGAANNAAATYVNKQLDLTGDPLYALNGGDITNLLSGGWFYPALKISGRGIDEALGFPAGGTLTIIQQLDEDGRRPEDIPMMLGELKAGQLAGLNRPVSLSGNLSYNLGRVKIEIAFGLKPNNIDESNLISYVREKTGSDEDRLSRLDMTFGLKAETSKSLIQGGISANDYIIKVGEYLKSSVVYEQLAQYAPFLKDKEIRSAALALANQTGTPREILMATGANWFGKTLGLDYPISIRGNFKDNLGQAKIEDRLGLKRDSFKDNLDNVINLNSLEKFASAFYLEEEGLEYKQITAQIEALIAQGDSDAAAALYGQQGEARATNAFEANSGYWTEKRQDRAKTVDAVLNIESGSTKNFITGTITLAAYVDKVGQKSLTEVTVNGFMELMDLEQDFETYVQTVVNISLNESLEDYEKEQQIFGAFQTLAGINIDNMTKFDPGTWNNILWTDPEDPEHTGIKNAHYVVLEQGKKWLPRWLGFTPDQMKQYGNWVHIAYEAGLEMWGPDGLYDEEAMVGGIMNVTKIPDENDAKKFLHGDFKGGVISWGAAQLVYNYNLEFEAQEKFKIDYATVKQAYFNDLTAEEAIGEAAVLKAREETGGIALSQEAETTIRQEAVRDHRNDAKNNLQYQAMDIQLHRLDKNIPAGFSKAMIDRKSKPWEKWAMGAKYVGNMIHTEYSDIPADLLPAFAAYTNPRSGEAYHNIEALKEAGALSFLDNQMKEWFGDFIQPGTAEAMFAFERSGWEDFNQFTRDLEGIYLDYGINIAANWADKEWDLPPGTTKMVYDYGVQYQAALKTYREASLAVEKAKTVGEGAEAMEVLENSKLKAEASINNLEAEAISTIITYAFQEELVKMDRQLGFVPGSSSMLVGMAVQYFLLGAINPWSIGLFVVTNLFGIYKIDVTCTACNYYPKITPELLRDQNCPLPEFDGKSQEAFKTNSITAAQWKVNKLIGDVLNMPEVLGDDNLRPTQIMTLRQEDVNAYQSQVNQLYGRLSGNTGLWANQLMWAHIHIGF